MNLNFLNLSSLISNFKASKLHLIFQLMRLDKPIGIYLLVLPCFMGLAIQRASIIWYVLFAVGAIAMRSFGCIINDICDRDFDKHVERTKNRPLASGALSVREALFAAVILLIIGFYVFWQLPIFSQIMCLIALLLSVIYPLMKRITYWPQAFLGLTFNFGTLITCFDQSMILIHGILFASCFFWTLAYDTIYGFQDIKDDVKIGVKSTSQVFKNHPKIGVSFFYALSLMAFANVGYLLDLGNVFFGILIVNILYTIYLMHQWNHNDSHSCRGAFIKNQYIGILMVLGFLISI